MMNELGSRFACPTCHATYLVFGPGDGRLACCASMQLDVAIDLGHRSADPRGVGQRYRCDSCGTATLCLAGGASLASCCGSPMTKYAPPSLPPVG